MTDFLFEIGLEEIPARMIAGAQAELERRIVAMLVRERLVQPGFVAKSFSTPRRLALFVSQVAERQQDAAEEMIGPSMKIAYKDGLATAAALAFAKKAGVELSDLRIATTPRGEYLAATAVKLGRAAQQVIAENLPRELAGIYWAKTMYWRPGKPERFVRPLRWMVAMLGNSAFMVEFAGYRSTDTTFGHRVLDGAKQIKLKTAGEYQERLLAAYVITDVDARRQRIRKELDRVCRSLPGMRWREDHALVEKLTHLTEWPSVILGSFEHAYLDLPEEVLVTVMRDHQSYFAVEDSSGNLAPHFLAVLNTMADQAGQAVMRHGNERVLRARFNDARFFWQFDQRTPLAERIELLEKVTFQKDLGSYAAKTQRVRRLGSQIAELVASRGGKVDPQALDQAAILAKTDLTTELVKEFTELQGEIGGLYARAQGYSDVVARAIHDQYKPESMEDRVPLTMEGALLAIADKVDTIAGMFGLGMEPTGSKDPFALRRAANGIVRILAETTIELGLGEIAFLAATGRQDVVRKIETFFAERLEFYLRDAKGQAYDIVQAVLASGADRPRESLRLAQDLTAIRYSEDFLAVCAAFKRMKNIVDQARGNGEAVPTIVDSTLLRDPAEKTLDVVSAAVSDEVSALSAKTEYKAALLHIATLRVVVDAFFSRVMVMAPEPDVRSNRLALLARILRDFSRMADFSEIVVAG